MICFVAFARGDPHLVTLDGLRYTFNGRGEYTLIQTTDNVFTLQGRMITASGVDETTVDATVFSAIAAKDNNSDTVQFEVDENKTLIATVSGELVIFDIAEQDFEKVTVQHLGSDTIEALFASGAYVKAKAENGLSYQSPSQDRSKDCSEPSMETLRMTCFHSLETNHFFQIQVLKTFTTCLVSHVS